MDGRGVLAGPGLEEKGRLVKRARGSRPKLGPSARIHTKSQVATQPPGFINARLSTGMYDYLLTSILPRTRTEHPYTSSRPVVASHSLRQSTCRISVSIMRNRNPKRGARGASCTCGACASQAQIPISDYLASVLVGMSITPMILSHWPSPYLESSPDLDPVVCLTW